MLALSKIRLASSAAVILLAVAACGREMGETTGPGSGAAPPAEENVAEAAAADPDRLPSDKENDERRKPAAALAFMKVSPGMAVFDIEAGSGYYTELLSHAVGPEGSVVMQNPQGFRNFVSKEIDARLADGRLANVRESVSRFDELDAPDASIDLATWVQGPHELYFKSDSGPLGDPATAYAEIFRILKPGGSFVAIDHSAVEGSPESTGNDLHRVDKAIVERMAQEAGFLLADESEFLANPDDPRTTGVFDPSIRGDTDQFALRFEKPE